MNFFVYLLTLFINVVFSEVQIRKGDLRLDPSPSSVQFTPVIRGLVGSDFYIFEDFPSDLILRCGVNIATFELVEFSWEVFGSNYTQIKFDEIELLQIDRNVTAKCSVTDKTSKDTATTKIVALTGVKITNASSVPFFIQHTSNGEQHYITKGVKISEGGQLNISCVSHTESSHQNVSIQRGDGSLPQGASIRSNNRMVNLSITGVKLEDAGTYICTVDTMVIGEGKRNVLQSCVDIEVVTCPTFPVFTINSKRKVGSSLTLQCHSTALSKSRPMVHIIRNDTSQIVARGVDGVAEYYIHTFSSETAVLYNCVALNECGTKSADFQLELCPDYSTLERCQSACPAECGINETERFNCLFSSPLECTPGCECVSGYSLHNGDCVPDYDCPDGFPKVSITGSGTRINFNTLDLCESESPYSLLCEVKPVDRASLRLYKQGGKLSGDQVTNVTENGSIILAGGSTRAVHQGVYVCEGNISDRTSQSSIRISVIPTVLEVKLLREYSHLPSTSHSINTLLYCRVLSVSSNRFRYTWYRDGVRIPAAYLPVYREIGLSESTEYSCAVSHGCSVTAESKTSILIMSHSTWHEIDTPMSPYYTNDTITLICRTNTSAIRLEWGDNSRGFELSDDESISVRKEFTNETQSLILSILRANIRHSGTYLCAACLATDCDSLPPINKRVIATQIEVLQKRETCDSGNNTYKTGDVFYMNRQPDCIDMVLLLDVSAGVKWLGNVTSKLESLLIENSSTRCEDRFGLTINQNGMSNTIKLSNDNLFGNSSTLKTSIEDLEYSGTLNNTSLVISTIIQEYNFRENAKKIIVLLTEEEVNNNINSKILTELTQNDITLYSIAPQIIQAKYKEDNYRGIGIDANWSVYIPDPMDELQYIKVSDGAPHQLIDGYLSLSLATGGEAWDINFVQNHQNALIDALYEESNRKDICHHCSCEYGELECVIVKEYSRITECTPESDIFTLQVSSTRFEVDVLSSIEIIAIVNIPGAYIRWYANSSTQREVPNHILRLNATHYIVTVRGALEFYDDTKYFITGQLGKYIVEVEIEIIVRPIGLAIHPRYALVYEGGDLSLTASLNISYPGVMWLWYFTPFSHHYTVLISTYSAYGEVIQTDSDIQSVLSITGVKMGAAGYYKAIPVANHSTDVEFLPDYVVCGVELTTISLKAWALKKEDSEPKILTITEGSTGDFFAAELSLPLNATFSWYRAINTSHLIPYTDGEIVTINRLGHASILTVFIASVELQGVWIVTAELENGMLLTGELFLIVTRMGRVDLYIDPVDLPSDNIPLFNQSLTLNCVAQGDPTPLCHLERNGTIVTSTQPSPVSYTIDWLDYPEIGMYECLCHNNAGVNSDSFSLDIGCTTDLSGDVYSHGYSERSCRDVLLSNCIVYFLDESRSMTNEHDFIRSFTLQIPTFGNDNTRFAVVGFGSYGHIAGEIIAMDSNGRVFGTADEALNALKSVETSGRREDGYLAMITQLKNLDLSRCITTQFMLFTDEDRDHGLVESNPHLTYDYVLNQLMSKHIILHVVVKEMFEGPGGVPLFGMDYMRTGYPIGTYDRVQGADWVTDTAHGNTNIEYTQLALALKGSVWDISKLRNFQFLRGFTDALVTQITSSLQKVCEECACHQGVYSCYVVPVNETYIYIPDAEMYSPGNAIFYQPSNPIITHGGSLNITFLGPLPVSIQTSSPNVQLFDTFVYIYDAIEYENIIFEVSVNSGTFKTEIIVYVMPCVVTRTERCESMLLT